MSEYFEVVAKQTFDRILEVYKEKDEVYGSAWQHVGIDVLKAVVLYKANRLYRMKTRKKLTDECLDIITLCLMILAR